MAHPNALLIEQLFAALNRHDAAAMAKCYCDDGVIFEDIAFHIENKLRLDAMWRMICEGESGIQVTVKTIVADERHGEARIIDTYQFGKATKKGKPGRPVVNEITSRFWFRGGLIERQVDWCDSRAWARQAIGGVLGWVAGRSHWLRARSADRKLDAFLLEHPRTARPAADQVSPLM
jgi:hypothetical protein